MQRFQIERGLSIIENAIRDIGLNLAGKVILTELGSNDFCFTPIIPAIANAKKVYAVVKDSKYGLASDIRDQFDFYFNSIKGYNRIEIFCNELPDSAIKEADIITNSSPLRPLNKYILSKTKKGVVIPLMYEAWEFRNSDIDINYCKENNIAVAGTWESHPQLGVFEYVSTLGLKLALNAGYEIQGNNIYIWSDDNFGKMISKGFSAIGGNVFQGVSVDEFYKLLPDIDFIFLCRYIEERSFFEGESPIFSIERIKRINSKMGIVHLYGALDYKNVMNYGFNVYPQKNGYPKHMTETLSYTGQVPVLKLITGGFKVGQELSEETFSNLSQILL